MLDNQIKPPKKTHFIQTVYMGTVAREPVTKSVILITYYEIGISPNKLHQ